MLSHPADSHRKLGRYVLGERLGHGATAEVWAASDGDREVAIKWWYEASPSLERELRALALLDLPGVVRLLDRGEQDGRPFAVTERIHGVPFPGPRLDVESVVRATRRLLSTLEGVHAVGVVHRDLKPGNVLVDGEGTVRLLDFGLASGALLGATLSDGSQVAGTMRTMAPEQLLGQHADPRSDLYAVGVMVWEALAGQALHGDDVASLVHRRLSEPARPLKDVAEGVPTAVCRCVDALLRRDPEARPGRAAEALAQLSARPLEGLPWLGPRTPIDRALALLREGRRCRIGGGPGSGVGRLMREVTAALQQDHELRKLLPSERPFGSLAVDFITARSVAEVKAHAREVLLGPGLSPVVWVADHIERLDPWTRELLDEVDVPVLARGEPADVRPERLTTEDVVPLFGGCERIHRLRSDPAALLVARTHGRAGRVAAELSSWVARGLARTEPYRPHIFVPPPKTARVWVDRESLDRLQEEPAPAAPPPDGLSVSMAEHLDWIAFVGPAATSEVVAELRGVPGWEASLERERLEALECVVMHEGGVQLLRGGQGVWAWCAEQRRAAHRRVVEVLEAGTAGRLRHLMALGELGEAAAEAAVVVREEHEAGRTARAYARAASLLEAAGAEPAAVDLWLEGLKTALSLRTKEAVGRLRRAAERQPPADVVLAEMVRAGDDILGGRPAQGLERLEGMAGHAREEVEVERFGLMVMAGQRLDVATQARAVDWAARDLPASEAIQPRIWTWRGLLAHRTSRYRESELAHRTALSARSGVPSRLSSMLNAASALIAAGELAEAHALCSRARTDAERAGHRSYLMRAEAMARRLEHVGGSGSPDLEWAEAAASNPVCLHVEAMIAIRGGHRAAEALVCATLQATDRTAFPSMWMHACFLRDHLRGSAVSPPAGSDPHARDCQLLANPEFGSKTPPFIGVLLCKDDLLPLSCP